MFDVQFVDVDLVQSSCCCFTIYKTITLIKPQTILRLITTSNVMILQVCTVPTVSLLAHTHVAITDTIHSECKTKESPLGVRHPNSDVLLTVHLSIILVINQLNAQNAL